MSWLASIGVALLTASAGLVCAGVVSAWLVDWYAISAFEGGAGFFVVGNALLGGLVGAVIGLVAARVVAARPKPGFVKALGVAVAVVVTVAGTVAGAARLLADIPPDIDGDLLFLQVELRWPASGAAPPIRTPGLGRVRLGALSGSVVRVEQEGPLWLDEATQIDGRWIASGAVFVFTSRGERLVRFLSGDTTLAAFLVPLPKHPTSDQRAWSAWTQGGGPTPTSPAFACRYRIVRDSDPLRTERVGAFEIEMRVQALHRIADSERYGASSRFRIRHRGAMVPGLDDAGAVAVVGGTGASLLAHAVDTDGNGVCRLVTDVDGRAVVTVAGPCVAPIAGQPLTSDAARFHAAADADVAPGWVDRETFAAPGLYRIGTLALDTRTLALSRFDLPSEPSAVPAVPPLGVSPDERSFVWFGLDGSDERPRLGVTDLRTGRSYALPIDRVRMRYNTFDALDPAWVLHHFAWRRSAEGVDELIERPDFRPLPYRGDLTLGKAGAYQSYTLRPGGEPLRALVVRVLTTALGGERLPDELDGFKQRVRIDGEVLEVTIGSSPAYVSVTAYKGSPDLMRRVGARLDAVLATGEHDALFAPSPESPTP